MCQKNATYKADYHCSNCEWSGKLEIKKGSLKPAKAECPNCGCDTAVQGTRPIIQPTRDGRPAPYKKTRPWQPWNEPYQWLEPIRDKYSMGDTPTIPSIHPNRTTYIDDPNKHLKYDFKMRFGINGPSEYMGNEYTVSN